MGMIRDSFIMFKNWTEAIETLPEEYQLECYKAVAKYGTTGVIPEDITPICKAMLISFSVGMESSIARYNARVENGKLGGRPKKGEDLEKPNETEQNLEKPNHNLEKPNETEQNLTEPSHNLNVNVNENENENANDTEKEESVKEESGTSPLTPTPKHRYGKYQNVLLTENEYNRLLLEQDGEAAIEYFSEYRERKGYKCKNDNLSIRKWVFDALKEERQRKQRLEAQQPIKTQQGTEKVSNEEAKAWK